MSKKTNKIVGDKGEEHAAFYLEELGFDIVTRNYKTKFGEIDIIAKEAGEIVFVEVKTRSSDKYGTALDALTPNKQKRIARVAKQFLVEQKIFDVPCRFDVVTVEDEQIEVVRGAFVL